MINLKPYLLHQTVNTCTHAYTHTTDCLQCVKKKKATAEFKDLPSGLGGSMGADMVGTKLLSGQVTSSSAGDAEAADRVEPRPKNRTVGLCHRAREGQSYTDTDWERRGR